MSEKYSKVNLINDISRTGDQTCSTQRAIFHHIPKKIDFLWNKIKIANYSLKHYSNTNILEENDDLIKTSIYACVINEIHGTRKLLYLKFSLLHRLKPIWDLLISFSLFFELLFLTFQDSNQNIDKTFWLILYETIIDCIFFIDAFYHIRFDLKKMPVATEAFEHPYQISVRKKIKLIIQIISCFPYQFLDYRLKYLKVLRIVNLTRMSVTFQEFMELILIRNVRYQNSMLAMIKLIRIFTLFFLVANAIASYWLAMAKNETLNSWMIDFSTNYFKIPTNFDYYIESLFFTSITMSSVGYGAYISVISDENENFYKMFIMISGSIIYALIHMGMKYVILKFTMNKKLMNQKKYDIKLFLMNLNNNNEYLFQLKLWDDIKILLIQNAESKSDDIFRNNKFFTNLSFPNQFEILKRTYSKFLGSFSDYFIGISDHFLYEFLIQLNPKVCQPNQILLRIGEEPQHIYYLMDGPVLVIDKNKNIISHMKNGDVVGDKSILYDQESKFSYKICKDHPIFCLTLEKSEMLYLISMFPSDILKIKLNITKIFQKKVKFIELKKIIKANLGSVMHVNDMNIQPSSHFDLHNDVEKAHQYPNYSDNNYNENHFNDYDRSYSEINDDRSYSQMNDHRNFFDMKFHKEDNSLNDIKSFAHELIDIFEDHELNIEENNLLKQSQQINDLRLNAIELKQEKYKI